jgi:hypothetical protein
MRRFAKSSISPLVTLIWVVFLSTAGIDADAVYETASMNLLSVIRCLMIIRNASSPQPAWGQLTLEATAPD